MSLFVANISKNVRPKDLKNEFEHFGSCTINQRPQKSFAFVEYNDERDAEDALRELNDKNMGGLKIAIQWSKRSGRYDPKVSRPPPRRDTTLQCYNCNRVGHFARDCTERRKSRSRSRSPAYDRRDGRRGDRDRDLRSRSRSPRRDRDHRYSSRRGGNRDDRNGRDNGRYQSRRRGSYDRYRSSRSRSPPSRHHDSRRDDRNDRRNYRDKDNRRSRSPAQHRRDRDRDNSYDRKKRSSSPAEVQNGSRHLSRDRQSERSASKHSNAQKNEINNQSADIERNIERNMDFQEQPNNNNPEPVENQIKPQEKVESKPAEQQNQQPTEQNNEQRSAAEPVQKDGE